MKKTNLLAALALVLIAVWGCSHFGLLRPRGPQALILLFTNESAGELKPCG